MKPETRSRILPESIPSSFGLALGAASDLNSHKYIWRVGWHEQLEIARSLALEVDGSTRLYITSKYPLVQRGQTENHSKPSLDTADSELTDAPYGSAAPDSSSLVRDSVGLSSTPSAGQRPTRLWGVQSRSARRDSNLVDFALLDVHDTGAHIPILVDLGGAPPVSHSAETDEGNLFDFLLAFKLAHVFVDICPKIPMAFVSHKQQKSIIALTCSGLWWTFSIVKRGDRDGRIMRSKHFVCGHGPHDEVLFALVEAGAKCSYDPASRPEVQQVLQEHISEPNEEMRPPATPLSIIGEVYRRIAQLFAS
ncbi:hypothetical protein RSOLAG22IIIB_03335 [Rhizoctonia solani]|uniref:Uncharacterized protein n=1 Tax=Rhizoctonia solani TaxID=456999 RepID=A0A0K6FPT0_9AGAM|nr:hypothetical protein RSOLAG22IIIB_03335 [Rhizoctonia solani]